MLCADAAGPLRARSHPRRANRPKGCPAEPDAAHSTLACPLETSKVSRKPRAPGPSAESPSTAQSPAIARAGPAKLGQPALRRHGEPLRSEQGTLRKASPAARRAAAVSGGNGGTEASGDQIPTAGPACIQMRYMSKAQSPALDPRASAPTPAACPGHAKRAPIFGLRLPCRLPPKGHCQL